MNLITDTPSLISTENRGLLYGDGLFETIKVVDGVAYHLNLHLQRLQQGCARLKISGVDFAQLAEVVECQVAGIQRSVLKILVTRGAGGRGYRPPVPSVPNVILTRHLYPEFPDDYGQTGVRVRTCDLRLASQPRLAGIKHLNRLENVLARGEWSDPAIAEGLLRDQQGHFIEGTMSNLFLVSQGRLITPRLDQCGVAGITRQRLMAIAVQQGIPCEENTITDEMIRRAEELFVCNSIIDIWPVIELVDVTRYRVGPVTRTLQSVSEGTVC